MLCRKYDIEIDVECLVFRLVQAHGDAATGAVGLPVNRIAQIIVEIVLRMEIEPLGRPVLPAGGAQIADDRLPLAAVEFGDLPELQGSARLRAAGLPLFTLVDFAGH